MSPLSWHLRAKVAWELWKARRRVRTEMAKAMWLVAMEVVWVAVLAAVIWAAKSGAFDSQLEYELETHEGALTLQDTSTLRAPSIWQQHIDTSTLSAGWFSICKTHPFLSM